MLSRLFTLALASILVLVAPTSAHGSDTLPAVTATTLGDGFHRVSGSNCAPTTEVTAVVSEVDRSEPTDLRSARSLVAHTVSDEVGDFDATVFVGSDPGDYVVAVSCGDIAQSVAIKVGDEPTTAVGTPVPKNDSGLPLVRLGLVLALTGLLTYLAARQRRTSMSRS